MQGTVSNQETTLTKHPRGKALAAAAIGTALEWFDFTLYGVLAATVFPKLFFPALEPTSGLLASLVYSETGLLFRSSDDRKILVLGGISPGSVQLLGDVPSANPLTDKSASAGYRLVPHSMNFLRHIRRTLRHSETDSGYAESRRDEQ